MRALWLLLVSSLLAACGDSSGQGGRSATGCITSCAQAKADCGVVNDLCGGVLECGYCPLGKVCGGPEKANTCQAEPCKPRMCEEDECGMVSDGCADVLDCGECKAGFECRRSSCQCQRDTFEPNDSIGNLKDLGVGPDYPGFERAVEKLTLSGVDVDWFQLAIRDENMLQNPVVRVQPQATDGADVTFHVSIYYNCDSNGESHGCNEGSVLTRDGRGCERTMKTSDRDWIELRADCTGPIDGGTASLEIRQECGPKGCAEECHLYTLNYQVTEYSPISLSLPTF